MWFFLGVYPVINAKLTAFADIENNGHERINTFIEKRWI